MKKKWIIASKRVKLDNKTKIWEPGPSDLVCSAHFVSSDYSRTGNRCRLLASAVPSKFPFKGGSKPETQRTIRYVSEYNQVPVVVNEEPTTRYDELVDRLKRTRADLKNSKLREKRLRETVASLRNRLVEADTISQTLSSKLDAYKGEICVLYL